MWLTCRDRESCSAGSGKREAGSGKREGVWEGSSRLPLPASRSPPPACRLPYRQPITHLEYQAVARLGAEQLAQVVPEPEPSIVRKTSPLLLPDQEDGGR